MTDRLKTVYPPKTTFCGGYKNILKNTKIKLYYRVIALISADIVPSLDIEGRELASVRRYPNKGQYSPISVR